MTAAQDENGPGTARGRVVVVAGATGTAGRAACAELTRRGDAAIAVGTDAGRLARVPAAEHRVADLADRSATARLADDIRERHGRIDGLLHLVGGWKPGWDEETAAWLNARLVTTLENAIEAFEPHLAAAPAGRLAIVSSTAVTREGPPTSAYAAAKLAAETLVERVAARWAGTDAAAVILVVRSIGQGAGDTSADRVADALADLWDEPAASLSGARIRL